MSTERLYCLTAATKPSRSKFFTLSPSPGRNTTRHFALGFAAGCIHSTEYIGAGAGTQLMHAPSTNASDADKANPRITDYGSGAPPGEQIAISEWLSTHS